MGLRTVKDFVEIRLLNLEYKFKRLTWEDTMSVKVSDNPNKDVLSYALVEVSGKKLSLSESSKVIDALPKVIMEKVFLLFMGSLDPRRRFSTTSLWAAPTALDHQTNLEEEESSSNKVADDAEKMMVAKFGREAVDEEKRLSKQILDNSGYKGAIRLTKESLDASEEDS